MIVQNMAAICPYRVGDYLCTENSTHPATSWPGTSWEQLQGRILMGASDTYPVGSEGGEAEHTLTVPEIPAHSHAVYMGYSSGSLGSAWARVDTNNPKSQSAPQQFATVSRGVYLAADILTPERGCVA